MRVGAVAASTLHAFAALLCALSLNANAQVVSSNSLVGQSATANPKPSALVSHLGRSNNPLIKPYAYVLEAALWPSRKIYVCWDNPTAADVDDRSAVQDAIKESWERVSGLSFGDVGKPWGECVKNNRGIRITIADSGPITLKLGRQIDGVRGGMVMNFQFKNWSPNCQKADMRTTCIRSIAIHEFGHALGFSHEQNRPKKPESCLAAPQGPNGDRALGEWDPESVMNYCYDMYRPDLKLSKLDIEAVRFLYGTESEK